MSTDQFLQVQIDEQRNGQVLGRRRVLQTVAAGAVGIGLVGGAGIAAADEHDLDLKEPDEKDLPKLDPKLLETKSKCPDLIKLSKHLCARLYLRGCERCPCGGDVNFIVPYHLRGFLYSKKPCDETTKIWPDQSKVAGEGVMTLRQTKCKDGLHLVGCNEGTIKLYGKDAGVVSEMFGTVGFETHAKGEARCCARDHGEGTLKGHGYEKLEGCTLCVSYVSHLYKLDAKDPCNMKSITMSANLDGVLICPCGKKS